MLQETRCRYAGKVSHPGSEETYQKLADSKRYPSTSAVDGGAFVQRATLVAPWVDSRPMTHTLTVSALAKVRRTTSQHRWVPGTRPMTRPIAHPMAHP